MSDIAWKAGVPMNTAYASTAANVALTGASLTTFDAIKAKNKQFTRFRCAVIFSTAADFQARYTDPAGTALTAKIGTLEADRVYYFDVPMFGYVRPANAGGEWSLGFRFSATGTIRMLEVAQVD